MAPPMVGLTAPPLHPVVLIIADDSVYAEKLSDDLRRCGIDVKHLNRDDFDPKTTGALALVDVVMVETHTLVHVGSDLLEDIRTAAPVVEVVAISSRPVVHESVRALRTGVFAVLEYPVDSTHLEQTVWAACQRKRRAAHRIEKLEHDTQWPTGRTRRTR